VEDIREVVRFLTGITGEGAVYEDRKVSVGLFDLFPTEDGVVIRSALFPGVLPHILFMRRGREAVWILRFYSPDGAAVPHKPILKEMGDDWLRTTFSSLLGSGYIVRFSDEGERVGDVDTLIGRIKHPALEPDRFAYLEVIGTTSEPADLVRVMVDMRKAYAKVYPRREGFLRHLIAEMDAGGYERLEGEWQVMDTRWGKLLAAREVGGESYGIFLLKPDYTGRLPRFRTDRRMANAPFVSGTVPDYAGDYVFLGYASDIGRIRKTLESLDEGTAVITVPDDLSPEEEEVMDVLYRYGSAVLMGPPGTGKTHVARRVAERMAGREGRNWILIQASPSLRYEEFVEGLRPVRGEGGVAFEVVEGPFLRMVRKAQSNPEDRFVVILDEMNRGNLPAILGNLLYALEYRGKPVLLPYSGSPLVLPENLFFIGTLNERDVSTLQMDQAILRRFPVIFFEPDEDALVRYLEGKGWSRDEIGWAVAIFRRLNEVLKGSVGHAYLFADSPQDLRMKLRYFIAPLLRLRLGRSLEEVLEGIL